MKYLFGFVVILFSTLVYADTVTCYFPNVSPVTRSGTVEDGKNGFR